MFNAVNGLVKKYWQIPLLLIAASTVMLIFLAGHSTSSNQTISMADAETKLALDISTPNYDPKDTLATVMTPAFKIDQELSFTFENNSSGWLDSTAVMPSNQEGNQTKLNLKSEGLIDLHVYQQEDNHWNIGGRLSISKFKVNGEDPSYYDELSSPFVFRLKKNGEIFDVQLSPSVSQETQQAIRQQLAILQFITPEKTRSSWHTRELDEVGVYGAEYTLSEYKDWALTKVRQGHEKPIKVGGFSLQYQRPESFFLVRIDPHYGWLQNVSGIESTETFVNGNKLSDIQSEVKISYKTHKSSWQFPADFSSLSKMVIGNAENQVSLLTDSNLDLIANGMELNDAIDYFLEQEQLQANSQFPEDFMVNFLRKYPEYSEELTHKLNEANSGLEENQELFLWYVLAKASMPENQRSLIAAAQDTSALPSTRMRAISAIHSVTQPIDNVVSGLWQLRQQPDLEISEMATLALGSLAGDETKSEEILAQLNGELGAAQTEDIPIILAALYNSQAPEAIDIASPYLIHDDITVRKQAYKTVINFGTDTAYDTAFNQLTTEPNDEVVLAALEASYMHKADKKVIHWVKQQLLSANVNSKPGSTNASISIEIIGTSLGVHPENEDFLRSMIDKGLPVDLKKEIFKYVAL